MLILILINVQYLQNVVFSFEKGSNVQNNSRFPPPNKTIHPQQNFSPPTKVCLTRGMNGWRSPLTSQKFAHFPVTRKNPPTKFLFLSLNSNFHVITQ